MFQVIKNFIKAQIQRIINKQHKFVFTHVPKCAGSSLSKSLLGGFYSGLIRNSPLTTGVDAEVALEVSKVTGIDDQTVRQIFLATFLESNKKVFVTGHCYAPPKLVNRFKDSWNFITILRDPTDRFISEFVYNTYKEASWEKNTLSIEEYIGSDKMLKSGVTYALFFSGLDFREIIANPEAAIELSVKNLKSYYKVGFLEELNPWIDELNKEFGVAINVETTNKSPNKSVANKIRSDLSKISRINELCSIDFAIYSQIKQHYRTKQ